MAFETLIKIITIETRSPIELSVDSEKPKANSEYRRNREVINGENRKLEADYLENNLARGDISNRAQHCVPASKPPFSQTPSVDVGFLPFAI